MCGNAMLYAIQIEHDCSDYSGVDRQMLQSLG